MPYCSQCGNIIPQPSTLCTCGGAAVQGLTSGFSKKESLITEHKANPSKTLPFSPTKTEFTSKLSSLPKNVASIPDTLPSELKKKPTLSIPAPKVNSPSSLEKKASSPSEPEMGSCSLCILQLPLNQLKKSWEQPGVLYCQGCWQVRPKTTGMTTNLPSIDTLKSTLSYQLGPISNKPLSGNLTQKSSIPTSQPLASPLQSNMPSPVSIPNKCIKCQMDIKDTLNPASRVCSRCQEQEKKNVVQLPNTNINICSSCKTIQPKAYFALPNNQLICEKCWVCKKCGKPMVSGIYVLEDDEIIHPECVRKTLCARCNTPITDKFIERSGQQIHSHCFTCADCKRSLAGIPFGMLIGKEFCKTCLDARET